MSLAVLCGCGGMGSAFAQEVVPLKQVSVQDRPRPEYDPAGVHVGAVRIYPAVSLGGSHDDNVFAQGTSRLSDEFGTVQGKLSVRSETRIPWSIFGNISSHSYADYSSEDRTDWTGGASIAQPIGSRTRATLNASLGEAHLSRDDPTFPEAAAEQPSVGTENVQLDVTHTFASGQLSLSTYVRSDDYDDARLLDGSTFDQDFRDRDTWNVDARTDFAVGASTGLFVRFTHNEQLYDESDPAALDRDAASDAVYGGTTFEISNLVRADLGIGVLRIDNEDPTQEDRTSLALASHVEFFVTPLITARLDLSRASGPADIPGSSSYVANTGVVGLDYELRRNVIIATQYSHSQRDYSGISGEDTLKSASVDVRWLLNRRLRASLRYVHGDQDWSGSQSGRTFTRNVYAATFDFML